MKFFRLLLVFFLCSLLSLGCKTLHPGQVVLHDSASVVERLIPVTIPADSAWLYALMECDSLNNIVIKQLSESKTKNMQTSYTLTQTGKQALLNYTAQTRPDTVYLKEKTISTYKEKPVNVPIPVRMPLRWWQKILIWEGAFLNVLIIIAIIKKIY